MPFSTNPKVQIVDASGDKCDDDSGKLNVNATITDVEVRGYGALISNANLAVSDTTREQLTTNSVPCKHIDIMPALSNTGIIYVGGDTVGAGNGIALYAGDVYSMDVTNVNLVYVLASVDAENIQWISYN